jgi:glucuronokinase
MSITSRVHARVGLLGNPSDGFFGKTISFSLANFYAQVRRPAALRVCHAEGRSAGSGS